MRKDEYNLEAFRSIRTEINLRIDIHYKLVLAKFALTGALLAYLITNRSASRLQFSPLIIAAVFAFLFDVIILENLGWIRTAGFYIKNELETTHLPVVRWERDAAQIGGVWQCFSVIGYLLGTWSIGVVLFLGALGFDLDASRNTDLFGFLVASYLLAYSIFLCFRHLGNKSEPSEPKSESPIVDDAAL